MYERELVSAVLKDPTQIDGVASIVGAPDFTDKDLGTIFEVLWLLRETGSAGVGTETDLAVLLNSLKARKVAAECRSPTFLAKLLQDGLPANAAYYAKEVRREAVIRRQVETLEAAIARAREAGADPSEIYGWIEAKLRASVAGHESSTESFDSIASRVIDDLGTPLASSSNRIAFTGINTIDEVMGPLRGGELAILAARPGVGKTAMSTQIALANAEVGRKCWYATLEMQPDELVTRVLCGLADVDSRDARSRDLHHDDLMRLEDSRLQRAAYPLYVWKRPGARLSHICAEARLTAATGELSLIVIDYIGLVSPDNHGMPRWEYMGEISKALKNLAGELGCVVMACCQLNRDAANQPPTLANLRDSGSIEQDADAVLMLHDEATPAERQHAHKVDCIIAKWRHGQIGKIPILFRPKRQTFSPIDEVQPHTDLPNGQVFY